MKFDSLKQGDAFGGELLKKKKNRHARPISTKLPMHLILKSSQAAGRQSFLHAKNLKRVRLMVEQTCRSYGVRLMNYANSGNHLHTLVKVPSREIYKRFIKTLTSRLAMMVSGAKKHERLKEKFWDYRPFTRIVHGRRGYQTVCKYIRLNELEAEGVIPHRDGRLKDVGEAEWDYF